MSPPHIADAESIWRVVNISPDLCIVGGVVVPFEIYRELTPEKSNYSSNVHARGGKVLHVASINQGVIGNAGSGVSSGVSQGGGNTIILQGSPTVNVNKMQCARHNDLCDMNVSA